MFRWFKQFQRRMSNRDHPQYHWPENALDKACGDQFYYACGLTTGEVFYFEEAKLLPGGWVLLKEVRVRRGGSICDEHFSNGAPGDDYGREPTFERGVEVRLSHVVWIADAPYGS